MHVSMCECVCVWVCPHLERVLRFAASASSLLVSRLYQSFTKHGHFERKVTQILTELMHLDEVTAASR